jgi:hypothetical protein
MNERQVRESQRKLVRQREEALAAVECLKAEITRLSAPVEGQVAERVKAAEAATAQARAQRDAVLADVEHVVAQRLGAKEQELIELHLRFAAKEKECDALLKNVGDLTADHQATGIMVAGLEARIRTLEEELASRKMVDAKELRKRIHDKTTQLGAAEKVIHSYQRVLKRMIVNGHRSALVAALHEENAAARLGEVEMEPLIKEQQPETPALQKVDAAPTGS